MEGFGQVIQKKPVLQDPSLSALAAWGKEQLGFLESREAETEAEILLMDAAKLQGRTALHLDWHHRLPQTAVDRYQVKIRERQKRIPLAYLRGKAAFWNEELTVGEGCLIPRPETEVLVEAFIARSGFREKDRFDILDLGCGSGAIGIALLRHYPLCRAVFSDISEKALSFTRQNLGNYDLLDRAEVVQSDLFEKFGARTWDAILSNPPYFADADWAGVQPEILKEPKEAFEAGKDGLDFYRRLLKESSAFLRKDGWLVLEAGQGQIPKILKIAGKRVNDHFFIIPDYAGIERVLMLR